MLVVQYLQIFGAIIASTYGTWAHHKPHSNVCKPVDMLLLT